VNARYDHTAIVILSTIIYFPGLYNDISNHDSNIIFITLISLLSSLTLTIITITAFYFICNMLNTIDKYLKKIFRVEHIPVFTSKNSFDIAMLLTLFLSLVQLTYILTGNLDPILFRIFEIY